VKIILLMITVLLTNTVQAESGVPWWQFWQSTDNVSNAQSLLFTEQEKQIIRSWFDTHRDTRYEEDDDAGGGDKPKKQKSLPPGLQKKLARGGELPPGWQKKVARGEVLDMSLYGHSRPLPKELLNRLASRPEYTEIRWLDDQVMRLNDDTRAILDVFQVD